MLRLSVGLLAIALTLPAFADQTSLAPAAPVTMQLNMPADVVYRIIAKLEGIEVIIDPNLKALPTIRVACDHMPLTQVLDSIAAASHTTWRAVGPTTISVSPKH